MTITVHPLTSFDVCQPRNLNIFIETKDVYLIIEANAEGQCE